MYFICCGFSLILVYLIRERLEVYPTKTSIYTFSASIGLVRYIYYGLTGMCRSFVEAVVYDAVGDQLFGVK